MLQHGTITGYLVTILYVECSDILVYVWFWSIGPHCGIPNQLAAENCRTGFVYPSAVPSLSEAVQAYHATGGYLTPPTPFGTDPLSQSPNLLLQRSNTLDGFLPTPEDLFSYTVNGYYQPFASSLLSFIDVTNQLSAYV